MSFNIARPNRFNPVRQLSIYAENKVGRLNELTCILGANNIHIMAFSSVDSTDSAVIRVVVDYTEQAIALLEENAFAFTDNEVVAVELNTEADLKKVTSALVETEINIHYAYPFLTRPGGKSAIVLRVEDNELAIDVLKAHQLKVLSQNDIAR